MNLLQVTLSMILLASPVSSRHHAVHDHFLFDQLALQNYEQDPIPRKDESLLSTRAHWMRVASSANYAISPCPFAPYGTAIVNQSSSSPHPGKLICTGINDNRQTGNPTMHGEMAAFANCSAILTDPTGEYRLSAAEASMAWKSFSLYTTAEPCPMCASAIAWAGLKEVVYGTSIDRLIELGWPQIEIGSQEVFERAWRLGSKTRVVENVLHEEMDTWFAWQFRDGDCPSGCAKKGSMCLPEE